MLYLHPQTPPPSVRTAYYEGFPHDVVTAFATGGLGWHHETGVQALRDYPVEEAAESPAGDPGCGIGTEQRLPRCQAK
jgi:hypothetical protein